MQGEAGQGAARAGEGAVVGIDIGGTKVACAALDASGELVARSRRPTDPSGDPERDMARMAQDLQQLIADSPIHWDAGHPRPSG